MENEVLASLKTNSYKGNPTRTIVLATITGLFFMFVGISVGLPIFFNMLLLIGGILVIYGFLTGQTVYQLTPSGIYRSTRPFINKVITVKESVDFIPYADIKSYTLEKDMTRSWKEVEILRIKLHSEPYNIWITDEVNTADFQKFCVVFMDQVGKVNESLDKPLEEWKGGGHDPLLRPDKPIERKKGFYGTVWAKVFTILLIAFSVALIYLRITGNLRDTSFLRFILILAPGTIYMIYRVYLKSEE